MQTWREPGTNATKSFAFFFALVFFSAHLPSLHQNFKKQFVLLQLCWWRQEWERVTNATSWKLSLGLTQIPTLYDCRIPVHSYSIVQVSVCYAFQFSGFQAEPWFQDIVLPAFWSQKSLSPMFLLPKNPNNQLWFRIYFGRHFNRLSNAAFFDFVVPSLCNKMTWRFFHLFILLKISWSWLMSV